MKSIIRATIVIILSLIIVSYEVIAVTDNDVYERLVEGEIILKDKNYEVENTKTVYLTFDDGPSKNTVKILDILLEEDICATFFVLGAKAENNEDILLRTVNEGHTIGNHTYSHVYKELYSSFTEYWKEIQKTEKIIYDITGVRTSIIRTPGGTYKNWDSFYFYYMNQADYYVYDWNVDCGDSSRKNISTEEIYKNIEKSVLKEKLVVLMHDGVGHENTAEVLPDIINYYRDKGYQFKPLNEDVKPIMFSQGECKWERENEYEIHKNFFRVYEEKTNNIIYKKTSIKTIETNNCRLYEAIYLYEKDQILISLDELSKIFELEFFIDDYLNIICIKQDNNFYRIKLDEPFYFLEEGNVIKYDSVCIIDSNYYLPVKPFINSVYKEIEWDKDNNYLLMKDN